MSTSNFINQSATGRANLLAALLVVFAFYSISLNVNASKLKTAEVEIHQNSAPVIYVQRCGFKFTDVNCGTFAKQAIFLNSDEFISFTDNWAVGREGDYKIYLSCIGPEDKQYIDGKLSLATVIVSGEDLGVAHEIAGRFLDEFLTEISGQNGQRINCNNN